MNPIDLDKDGDVDRADAKLAGEKINAWRKAWPFCAGAIVGVVGDRLFRLFFF